MPDITMCGNLDCPIKMQCYRFMAEPSYRQSYTNFGYLAVRIDDKGTCHCPHFVKILPTDKLREVREYANRVSDY